MTCRNATFGQAVRLRVPPLAMVASVLFAALLVTACGVASAAAPEAAGKRSFDIADNRSVTTKAWKLYKTRFMAADGRIIDTFTGVSHSESQGTGLILSAMAGDRSGFDRIWRWTDAALRRDDGLFSWRFDPAAADPVADPNNATDGDLMIAWGLLLADRAWPDAGYRVEARRIAAAIAGGLVRSVHGGELVLLPGMDGFEREGALIVNPSYYVLPALRDLASAFDLEPLDEVANGFPGLLALSRWGDSRLPLDWVSVGPEGAVPAAEWPARFGYEAIRVPLYLAWDASLPLDLATGLCSVASAQTHGGMPGWVDLETGAVAPYQGSVGHRSILALAAADCGEAWRDFASDYGSSDWRLAVLEEEDDYYAASLVALSLLAEQHRSSVR